ncbi:hypothetical protein [Colwellia sp. PAMC 21821]|uniref:hypothetical protein n=1 Tax=Colwellia sp. PAMC 21821 TaxID=1816219 RepID=UPI0009BCD067|nr:hypothetical protein [Colwellia sp. PAMC 21821]ARD43521.1 hypothetical protein A3Q33_03895 [Colwellia sp. PAMC 21821]
MNISPNQIIATLPAIDARALLRKIKNEIINLSLIVRTLDISYKKALSIIEALSDEGFIELSPNSPPKYKQWLVTKEGSRLALASARGRYKKSTVDKSFREFLQRVNLINNDKTLLYRVKKVVLFGSYLDIQDTYGDIDLICFLENTITKSEEFSCLKEAIMDKQADEGRHFTSWLERCASLEYDVRKKLKNRSPILSLHSECEGVINHTDSKVIYEINRSHKNDRSYKSIVKALKLEQYILN